jgi:hypothetical protein
MRIRVPDVETQGDQAFSLAAVVGEGILAVAGDP